MAALASQDRRFRIVAGVEAAASPALGRDVGEVAGTPPLGVRVAAEVDADFDVLVDFSTPAAWTHWLEICTSSGLPLVSGVTGLNSGQRADLEAAARRIAVLHSPNMSVGVHALCQVVGLLAGRLGPEYDVEIIEAHHRFKEDAPSGTAWALADAVRSGRGTSTPAKGSPDVICGRTDRPGPRRPGEIGIHAIRGGDVVGEHEVRFTTLGETITLRHVAHSRDTFARGALAAAAWIVGRSPGLYTMADVLGPSDKP